MLSKEQIAYFDKNPEMVSTADLRELIAMLRESQKDAARYRFWRNHTLAAISGSTTDYIDQTIDAAMQLDCDGSNHIVESNEMVKDSALDPLTLKNAITYTP